MRTMMLGWNPVGSTCAKKARAAGAVVLTAKQAGIEDLL